MSKEAGYEIGIYVAISLMWLGASLILIWMLTFYKLWNLDVTAISVRRPKCVILFNILCCISLYIRAPLGLFLSINMERLFHQLFGFQILLACVSSIGMIYVVLFRTWMVYYDIKCVQSLEDAQWIYHIDTTNQHSKSWYIVNRKIFGNPKYVILILFIPWSLFTTIGTIASFVLGRNKIVHICLIFNCIIAISLLFVLSCKLPKFNDYYKLRKETKISSLSTAICLSLGFVGLAAQVNPGAWLWIIVHFAMASMKFLLGMFSLYGVFITFNLPKLPCFVDKYNVGVALVQNEEIDVNNYKLLDIFKDDELFKLFARHLCREFAVEILLFFLETQQFLECVSQYLEDQFLSSPSSNIQQTFSHIKFSDKLPKSSIVKNVKDLNGAIVASTQLFTKYIDSDRAEFMINLPWEQRKALHQFFGVEQIKNTSNNNMHEQMKLFMINNDTKWKDLYAVFDDSRTSIFRLMTFSFARFKTNR